jgi:hypothetical protein
MILVISSFEPALYTSKESTVVSAKNLFTSAAEGFLIQTVFAGISEKLITVLIVEAEAVELIITAPNKKETDNVFKIFICLKFNVFT